MNKFKINSPLSNKPDEEIKAELFGKDAEEHIIKNNYQASPKPTKSFTVPLTEEELSILNKIAIVHDRSKRYMARKLLAKALIEEFNKINS